MKKLLVLFIIFISLNIHAQNKKTLLREGNKLYADSSYNDAEIKYRKSLENDQDYFNLLRKIQRKPKSSQRELAKDLGFSVGKLNYCIKALKSKGKIKIKNFKKNPKKINYIYVLTPKGIAEKTELTLNFMKIKMKEYDQLKKEIKKL